MINPFDTNRGQYDQSVFGDVYGANQDIANEAMKFAVTKKGSWEAAKASARGWEDRMKYQADLMQPDSASSGIGAALQVASIGASLFCERRLKQQIRPLDDRSAWEVVRDLPIYQFEYRHRPGVTVYGPMVDEVEAIDPLLVRPMDYEAEALGIADGQPIRGVDLARQQAYETLALQQALRRVESLESRVLELEARLMGVAAPPATGTVQTAVPCWGGLDEMPLVLGGPA